MRGGALFPFQTATVCNKPGGFRVISTSWVDATTRRHWVQAAASETGIRDTESHKAECFEVCFTKAQNSGLEKVQLSFEDSSIIFVGSRFSRLCDECPPKKTLLKRLILRICFAIVSSPKGDV